MKKAQQSLRRFLFMWVFMWVAFSIPAQATVSEYSEFVIPYQLTQSEFICLSRQVMEAEFGIPLGSVVEGVFTETKTLHQNLSGDNSFRNINLLAKEATIFWTLNFDRYEPDTEVYDYSFTLDLDNFNTLYGNTLTGRQSTVNVAKLAIISIIKSAELIHGKNKFRIWITLDNLPSQQGLSGLAVQQGEPDWPSWPFTSDSSLYLGYLEEMINSDCQS